MADELQYKENFKAYVLPTLSTSDTDLLQISTAWFQESKRYHNELEKIWKQNEDYYRGKQTFMERVPADMSNAVENYIFMGVETIVPIITANPPQFLVEPPEESDQAVKYAYALQKVLSIQHELRDVRTKGEMLVRHMVIYRFGCWKVFWNEEINDIDLKWVRPQRLYFPKVATKLPYIMEQVDITSQEFRDVFGDTKFKDFLQHRGQEFDPNQLERVEGIWTIWEIWTNDMVFWKYGSMIIDKEENPHFDFKKKKNNHFDTPEKPYIIASAFRLGNAEVGETDLIQQVIPIQDVINVSTRLIINNANKTGNAQWFVDPEVMTEEEANTKITNSPGIIIYGSGVANPSLLRRDPPPPLPSYIENIKIMAARAFDNIFGTHATTRGERGEPETLGGRLLLKQADIGRIDLIVREYERCIALLGNWFTQLIKLNYTGKKRFKVFGEPGNEFVEIMPEMVKEGTKVIVKSGTTLPTDELSKRREALELWSLNALDPVTLFERLKFPNPEEAAKRLQAWRQGQIAEEQAQREAGAQGRQLKPQPSAQGEISRMTAKMEKPRGGAM